MRPDRSMREVRLGDGWFRKDPMTTSADAPVPTAGPHVRVDIVADVPPDTADDQAVEQSLAALREAAVMMVDDDPVLVDVVQASLEEAGYGNFTACTEPLTAIDRLQEQRPDVLFLDMVMPGITGLDILGKMRDNHMLMHTPVIVLTASSDPKIKLRALELGAADVLAKPVDPSELILRLRNTLAAKAYRDRIAYFDPVTGLPNRRMFIDRLDWACKHAQRYGSRGAVLHVDMDRFKQINEALGPAAGDLLLKQVAARFAQCIRLSDSITRLGRGGSMPSLSRLGGDEFTVLLPDVEQGDNAALVAQRLLEALHEAPFHNGSQELFLAASIGVAVFPDDGDDVDTVLKNAGAALSEAKGDGRRQVKFYSKEFNARAAQRLNVEAQLRRALERDELRVFFQPKVDTRSRSLVSAEVLVRWQHPERGLVGPLEFIPVAENAGLIVPIGDWVLVAACRQMAAWRDAGIETVPFSVNVSALQLREPGFTELVARALKETGIPSAALCVELTETVTLDQSKRTTDALARLSEMGLGLSIDDFGAGYTSLSYLKRHAFTELKIDKTFIDGIGHDADSGSIVAGVIALAHNLGLTVVAEGVETPAQHAFLQAKGCDECQGYLFSRPLAPDAFEAYLRDVSAAPPGLRAVG
jgi:diguanylate cyclase (GGDEF)-like protein